MKTNCKTVAVCLDSNTEVLNTLCGKYQEFVCVDVKRYNVLL
jgi:hypothetical protein